LSLAFETTPEDIKVVLAAHGAANPETMARAVESLSAESDRIEKAALWYLDIDDQTASALDEIENVLIEEGVLPENARKAFTAP